MRNITTETQRHGGKRDKEMGGRGDAGKKGCRGREYIIFLVLVFSVFSVPLW